MLRSGRSRDAAHRRNWPRFRRLVLAVCLEPPSVERRGPSRILRNELHVPAFYFFGTAKNRLRGRIYDH